MTSHQFRMPGEFEPHSRCWMAWPARRALWGAGKGKIYAEACAAYGNVAHAISQFEPVTMVVNPPDAEACQWACGDFADVLPLPIDDSWMRDTGPIFVVGDELAAVDWGFNGWGGKYDPIDQDQALAWRIASHIGCTRRLGPMVLEGGALTVDGQGTLITTEECLLNPNRNPHLSQGQIETILKKFLGVERIVWLKAGVPGDETDGHVDNVCAFVKPGLVLAAAPFAEELRGHGLQVMELPGEKAYVNFYIANGGVVMPGFGIAADAEARATVQAAFPDRQVVQVPTRAISKGGGNIHCITQQEPACVG